MFRSSFLVYCLQLGQVLRHEYKNTDGGALAFAGCSKGRASKTSSRNDVKSTVAKKADSKKAATSDKKPVAATKAGPKTAKNDATRGGSRSRKASAAATGAVKPAKDDIRHQPMWGCPCERNKTPSGLASRVLKPGGQVSLDPPISSKSTPVG